MIEPSEALAKVLEYAVQLDEVSVPTPEAMGYTLATDVYAGVDIPPFDNSAMDGFAVRADDIRDADPKAPVDLLIIDDQPAGRVSDEQVETGKAIKVMTGAPIPVGTECVVPVENTQYDDKVVRVIKPVRLGANMRYAGEDMASGSLALVKGSVIEPVDIGLLASLGIASASVIRKPRVAVIGTGDELVAIDAPLEPGKIRDSNSYVLLAAALRAGAVATRLGVARDTKEDVAAKLREALRFDVVVTSGGVSVGERDFVKEVLKELGAQEIFWKVAQKPGKPVAFWILGERLIFALPGNPVASAINFEEYVRPALLKMMGRSKVSRPVVQATLTEPFRKKPGRTHFVGMVVETVDGRYEARLNGTQGSGILKSLSGANGVGIVPKEVEALEPGDTVKVQLVGLPEDH